MLISGALTVDCIEFQLLTVDYAQIYGSIYRRIHTTPPLPRYTGSPCVVDHSCDYWIYGSDT